MSYFSHNPEAWDEIERRGVAEYLAGHMSDDDLMDGLTEALIECQMAGESHAVWRELTKLARKQISGCEEVFWGSFAL